MTHLKFQKSHNRNVIFKENGGRGWIRTTPAVSRHPPSPALASQILVQHACTSTTATNTSAASIIATGLKLRSFLVAWFRFSSIIVFSFLWVSDFPVSRRCLTPSAAWVVVSDLKARTWSPNLTMPAKWWWVSKLYRNQVNMLISYSILRETQDNKIDFPSMPICGLQFSALWRWSLSDAEIKAEWNRFITAANFLEDGQILQTHGRRSLNTQLFI